MKSQERKIEFGQSKAKRYVYAFSQIEEGIGCGNEDVMK